MGKRQANNSESKKVLAELIDHAQRQRWKVKTTGGGHYRWTSPNKAIRPVFTGATSGGGRGMPNALAALRRAGLKIPTGTTFTGG